MVKKMSEDKITRAYEEFMVVAIPILIIVVILGGVWAAIDYATPTNPLDLLSNLFGGSGVLGFFTNLPSDGLKILLVGSIVEVVFVLITVGAVTAKDGRRFWYKTLFRKEPP